MKFYIIDDDMGIVQNLKNIIVSADLGEVIGYTQNPDMAITEIAKLQPDITLVDFLMPGKDGLSVIEEVKHISSGTKFIMISQISDKQLISDAYSCGVEFFIQKPINIIEVKSVVEKVIESIRMQSLLKSIKNIMNTQPHTLQQEHEKQDMVSQSLENCRKILNELGIIGEKGSNDILGLVQYVLVSRKEYDKNTVSLYGQTVDMSEKIIRQRIRRALKKGMENIASLGVEDYCNPTFEAYANTLFDFAQVRMEMDLLRGKSSVGAKINVDKFISTLFLYLER